ncbi:DUF4271 domain-containing protein [Ohtaekwangia sp.]|uniref:DUF4271 domain-containing protein n=1 Tax=Ohtaekwangia sp. TaxID=2066019 RepID=UPI002F93689F
MKLIRHFIAVLLMAAVVTEGYTRDTKDLVVKTDLRSQWKIFQQDQYLPFDSAAGDVSTIYFQLLAAEYSGDFLLIKDSDPVSLFVNGKFAAQSQQMLLDIDSLSKAFASDKMMVGVRTQGNVTETLVIQVRSLPAPVKPGEEILYPRSSSFRDFAVVSFTILVIMLITTIRLNPKLASDYFSINKIFSLRESDEAQVYSRITSSSNILFYVFCSLMLAYYLMIIFHFVPEHHTIAFSFQSESFSVAMLQWLKLSGILLGIFFVKIILIYGLTAMFGANEIAGVHFFNWVRMVLIFFGALTIVLSVYFIMHGQQVKFFSLLLKLLSWVLAGWMILIGLKLSNKMGQSMFHLFSYICATELIPFLITLKVLYN